MKLLAGHPSRDVRIAIFKSPIEDLSLSPKAKLRTATQLVADRYISQTGKFISADLGAVKEPIRAILIKPVSDHCNLRCTYCYEGSDKSRFKTKRISTAILEKTIRLAFENCGAEIEFIWHGGEPLLAGKNIFIKGLDFQRKLKPKTVKIYNSIQTNGLMLDDTWLNFLKENGFSIGVSLDAPQDIHDNYRIDSNGVGTFERVSKSIQRLKEYGIPFGVITVIHRQHIGRAREYLQAIEFLGINSIDIHPNLGNGESDSDLSAIEFSDFAIELFEEWLSLKKSDIRINLFDDFIRGYFFTAPETCYFSGTCGSILAVEANGDLVPCTRPFDRTLHTFGNLTNNLILGSQLGPNLSRFREWDQYAQDTTAVKCKWHHLCHNGCPQHRVDANGNQDVRGANKYCACVSGEIGGYYSIWEHISNKFTELFL